MRLSPIVLSTALLAACERAPAPAAASPVAKVRNAGYFEPIVNLELDFGDARSGAMLTQAGHEALLIGKAMISGKPPVSGEIDKINFTVLGKAKSDSAVERKIAHFSYPAQELRQLANIGLDGDAMLDAAQEVGTWTPSNDDVVNDYCTRRTSSAFCDAAK